MDQHLFISHSSRNDDVVKRLREVLELEGFVTWVDSRELSGGDILSDTLTEQIKTAGSFVRRHVTLRKRFSATEGSPPRW